MTRRATGNLGAKPLLSIEETAVLLGETRSTLYRAVKEGTLPLPVYMIGRRLRIPRLAVERMVSGLSPTPEEPSPEEEVAEARSTREAKRWITSASCSRQPTWSAVRRSSPSHGAGCVPISNHVSDGSASSSG